jgi:hypothetical protein
VEEILNLSKNEEYTMGHPYFSEHGVSEAFVRTRISIYSQKWDAVYDDFLFDLVEKIETQDGYIKSIVSKE